MQSRGLNLDCQLTNLSRVIEGPQDKPPLSLRRFVRIILGRRRLRALKTFINDRLDYYERLRGKKTSDLTTYNSKEVDLKAGDLVRVRPVEEIQSTLDHFGQLKGCSFAPEMEKYCGTTQRVLKRVERFVDERDFKILRTKGILLLEGIYCEGVASLDRCDRSCFFFWREEWLEAVAENSRD